MLHSLSTSSADFIESINRPVVVLSKEYARGHHTGLHIHERTQFLFATQGTMRARTQYGSWIVPPAYGLLIPGGMEHEVEMLEEVSLRSAYIQPAVMPEACLRTCRVIQVPLLLSACIDRFASRPLEYDNDDIAGNLAAIIIKEIATIPPSAMALPFPATPKFQAMTDAMLNNPSIPKSIDDWAFELGMSRRSFTRAFRQDTGLTFDQWRQRLRFQAAAQLIASGQPLSRIAPKVGYTSAAALKAMMNRLN
ncbi:AraC family transcriptional regulator [Kordiimonas aquimaris]|uniref:AraC family transcriptional regulator n=1 Tax=Kordiimonas aquimaris TaxID=707591 RepID=UPI0021D190A2|nr:helix-turn-helix transcriptional regulator [Kordiimonas aquimaris]